MRVITLLLLAASRLLGAETESHREVPYGNRENTRQRLDLYAPTHGEDHPVIVWVQGDDQIAAKEAKARPWPEVLAEQGCVCAAIDGRLATSPRHLTEDVAVAVGWICEHIKGYRGDPDQIVIAGTSSGALTAALLCTDERYLAKQGRVLSLIKGCVVLDGDIFDIPARLAAEPAQTAADLRQRVGNDADVKDLSPALHVSRNKGIPPFLILQSTKKSVVEAQGRLFYERLIEAGGQAKAIIGDGKVLGLYATEASQPLNLPCYRVFGFFESTIRPRSFEMFRNKLTKSVTPVTAEHMFGTPNGVGGSSLVQFYYDIPDGARMIVTFGEMQGRNPLSGKLVQAGIRKSDGTIQQLELD